MPTSIGARTTTTLIALAGAAVLGACTGSDGQSQARQTDAKQTGSIGPGSSAGTSSVNPNTQSTKTEVDSTPDLRPDRGAGSD